MAGRWKRARITLTIDAPWPFKGKRTISAWDERVPDYSPNDADRAWIARNLGDVPMRIIDRDSVPVESLGRES